MKINKNNAWIFVSIDPWLSTQYWLLKLPINKDEVALGELYPTKLDGDYLLSWLGHLS